MAYGGTQAECVKWLAATAVQSEHAVVMRRVSVEGRGNDCNNDDGNKKGSE